MSYVFFEDVLEELGHKLTYDAIVNYAGNGFVEKSWDMIVENNPMNLSANGKSQATMKSLAGFFEASSSSIKVGKPPHPKGNKGAKKNGKD